MPTRLAALALLLPALAFSQELDSPVAPASSVTFEQAVERARQRNPTALVARQEILRAEALVREARAASFPTLAGGATGTQVDHERKSGAIVVQGATSLGMNLQLALPLLAAQRWMLWLHARDQAELSRASELDVRRSLAATAARAYLAVIAQRRNLEVSDRAFRTAQAHYQYAHGRRAGGVGTRLDEVRAEQEEEATRATAQLARSGLARAQEALGVVLAEDAPVDAAAEATLPVPASLDAALKDAAGLRTDVKLARGRLTAAKTVVHDSWADFMPSLTGTFQPFFQNPPTLTQPETGWQAQLVLSVPFYDGGLRYGQQQEREALAAESQLGLDALLRQVQSDTRATWEALKRADEALKAAQRSARLGLEALDLATQAYAAGATTNLEVIDAERRARDAETQAAIAEDGARQARLDLLSASGRFP